MPPPPAEDEDHRHFRQRPSAQRGGKARRGQNPAQAVRPQPDQRTGPFGLELNLGQNRTLTPLCDDRITLRRSPELVLACSRLETRIPSPSRAFFWPFPTSGAGGKL